MTNAFDLAKKFLKYKLLKIILSAATPLILFILIMLLIIAPLLLLFLGSDNGPSYSINYDGIQHTYTNDLQGWTNFLNSKKQKFQEKIKKRGEQQPKTTDRNGQSIDSYTTVEEHYYTNEGDSAYITNNSKEIISMMMVYFEQEYSDGTAIFQYLNKLFDASHHAVYKESSLYGCTEGCQERSYLCSDNLDGFYDNCFPIPKEKEEREKSILCTTYATDAQTITKSGHFFVTMAATLKKLLIIEKKLYQENSSRGGCVLRHGIRYNNHAFCSDYSEIPYHQFSIKRQSGMPAQNISYKWNIPSQHWELKIDETVYSIYPNTSLNAQYLTKGKNGAILNLKYNSRLNQYEYYNTYYQCKEYTCPGHVESVPGTCLGNHIEKICYGHVNLEASICVDTFPQIYNDDTIGNLTGNAKPGESLEIFVVTAYCPCSKCCGKYANGITASGTVATEGRTIAVDPQKIPYGTRLVMNCHIYIAEDCGSGVNGNHIDLFARR